MLFTATEDKRIDLYFKISILLKGAISVAEIIAAAVIYVFPISLLDSPLLKFAQESPVSTATYIAVYLLVRGVIKVLLIAALLKRQLWAYPLSLCVLGLFVLYQLYQIATTHSLLLCILSIFDLVVMYFIWKEYQLLVRSATTDAGGLKATLH